VLLESFLAVSVVCCCAVGLSLAAYKGYVYPAHGQGNAVLGFGMAVGQTANKGLGLPVAFGALGAMLMFEGFAVTTLDTSIRLTRYLLEEAWAALLKPRRPPQRPASDALAPAGAGGLQIGLAHPTTPTEQLARPSGPARLLVPFLQHYWLNSAIAVGLMLLLAMTNGYKAIWALFASANQLWAGLGLLIASFWLLQHNRRPWITAIPAALMLVTTLVMLVRLLVLDYLPDWRGKAPLLVTDLAVLILTGAVLATAARSLLLGRAVPARSGAAASVMTSD
jgi:carbon starvation protein